MPEIHPALILLSGAVVVAVVPRRAGAAVAVIAAVIAGLAVLGLDEGTHRTVGFYGYDLTLLRADRLARAFALVFALAAVLGSVFGMRTMGRVERAAALAYAGSAFGVVLAGDLLTLFVFWELKVVTSVLVIWARHSARSGDAGLRYLFVHLAGGITLLGGILWWLADGNGIAFDAFASTPASWVILAGFAVSAAAVPVHSWLVDAYPEASIAGAVFLSAFTTKSAVYALARGFPGTDALLVLGVVMALYGVLFAMLQNDIRRLLSYHIVSQVGFMVAAVGLGTAEAINGATAHAFAHIIYKGLLFMAAGAVIHATGRRRLSDLGGLARAMPLVLGCYMVAALSISGVPLFSGFVSKEMVLDALYQGHEQWAYWALKLASVGTFVSVGLKLPYLAWFNAGPGEPACSRRPIEVRALPASMLVAMAAAAAINVVLGVAPTLLYDVMPFPVQYQPFELAHLVDTVQFLAFVVLAFWLVRHRLGASRTVSVDVDWTYRELPALVVERGRPLLGAVARTGAALAEVPTVARDRAVALLITRRRPHLASQTSVLVGVVIGAFALVLAASIVT